MYGGICRRFILVGQWAHNNHAAVWLSFLSYIVLAVIYIFSNISIYISIFLVITSGIFAISLILKHDRTMKWLMMAYVRYRFDQSTIAVLDGRIDERDQSYHIPNNIRYLPQNWKDQLEVENLRVDLIPVSKISKKYSMIINPFGSYYIEEDFTNLKSLNKIKDFIHEGGIFVNTWNIAFWESWNPREKLKGATSPGVETYVLDASPWSIEEYNHRFTKIPLQPRMAGLSLINTWLLKNFGVHTTTFERPIKLRARPIPDYLQDIEEMEINEFRAAVNCEIKDMTFHGLISARWDRTHECYPVSAIKYYIGYLVLFGTDTTNDH